MQTNLLIDPINLLNGLRNLAHTPLSAICEIIDNAIDAGAANIFVLLNRPNNVSEYLIIDDGKGMDEAGIQNALTLGSDDSGYGHDSLSKFGLGLKSAAFSQGDELDLISSPGGGAPFLKFRVAMKAVQAAGEYFADVLPLDAADRALIARYLAGGKGSIVRVGSVRKEGHPSVRDTTDVLEQRLGVIYYYSMRDGKVSISLENKPVAAVDVLFTDEADQHGNLEEDTWNGRETRWIQRQKENVLLDEDHGVRATLEVTQMPHPPSFSFDGRGEQTRVGSRYFMEAGNYGFYVYRNGRLISWAERFVTGTAPPIIPTGQKYFAFRGRINVDDTADTAFNIDVKKSSLTLSAEASRTLSDLSANYKRKSVAAWKKAAEDVEDKRNKAAQGIADALVTDLPVPETLPGKLALSDSVREAEEKAIALRMKARIVKEAAAEAKAAADEGIVPDPADGPPPTAAERFEETLKGDTTLGLNKVFLRRSLPDNHLWEPYFDADHGHCVRINRLHRFSQLVYDDNSANVDMRILFELFLHQAAVAEVEFQKRFKTQYPDIKPEYNEILLADFRKDVSEYLANMCRQLEGKLPPIASDAT